MSRKEIVFGLMAAVVLAVFLSPFASPWPDGLERVAEDEGFLEKAQGQALLFALLPDYAWPGLKSETLATQAAGFSGTLIVFGLGYSLAVLLRRKD